jgi:hypothetical protein
LTAQKKLKYPTPKRAISAMPMDGSIFATKVMA